MTTMISGRDSIQGFVIGLRMPECPSWMTPDYWRAIYMRRGGLLNRHSDPATCPMSIGDIVVKGAINSAFEIGQQYEIIGLHWTNSGYWRATIAIDHSVCDWQNVGTRTLRKVSP